MLGNGKQYISPPPPPAPPPRPPPPPPSRTPRALRWLGWNVFLLSVGLASVAGVAEVWLRATTPFMDSIVPWYFHPKAGLILKPNAEVRITNGFDFWTISRTNSLGFLDREPIAPERAAASCHITMIGDSFVEAKQVSITEKFHVRFEDLAAQQLPHLNITTSAFGTGGTGQISQLPYYEEFARHLHPKLLTLVFVENDFQDNSPVLTSLIRGIDPGHSPFMTTARDENGLLTLRPPNPDYHRFLFHREHRSAAVRDWLERKSFLYLLANKSLAGGRGNYRMGELLNRYPHYATLLNGLTATTPNPPDETPYGKVSLPLNEEAVEFTAFALDQFKTRAERDGAQLAILSTHHMGIRGSPSFNRLNALADARGIPVINQQDFILRRDADLADASWAHDNHWNPTGHRWAAEALLEYLELHPEICD